MNLLWLVLILIGILFLGLALSKDTVESLEIMVHLVLPVGVVALFVLIIAAPFIGAWIVWSILAPAGFMQTALTIGLCILVFYLVARLLWK